MHHEYPKWIYPGGDAARGVLVRTPDEEAAIAAKAETKVNPDGTKASPAPLPNASPADPLAGLDDAAVRALAKEKGVKVPALHLLKGDKLREKVRAALAG